MLDNGLRSGSNPLEGGTHIANALAQVIPTNHGPTAKVDDFNPLRDLPSLDETAMTVPRDTIQTAAMALVRYFEHAEIKPSDLAAYQALSWLALFAVGPAVAYGGSWTDCHAMNLLSGVKHRMPRDLIEKIDTIMEDALFGLGSKRGEPIIPSGHGGNYNPGLIRTMHAANFLGNESTIAEITILVRAIAVPGLCEQQYSYLDNTLKHALKNKHDLTKSAIAKNMDETLAAIALKSLTKCEQLMRLDNWCTAHREESRLMNLLDWACSRLIFDGPFGDQIRWEAARTEVQRRAAIRALHYFHSPAATAALQKLLTWKRFEWDATVALGTRDEHARAKLLEMSKKWGYEPLHRVQEAIESLSCLKTPEVNELFRNLPHQAQGGSGPMFNNAFHWLKTIFQERLAVARDPQDLLEIQTLLFSDYWTLINFACDCILNDRVIAAFPSLLALIKENAASNRNSLFCVRARQYLEESEKQDQKYQVLKT